MLCFGSICKSRFLFQLAEDLRFGGENHKYFGSNFINLTIKTRFMDTDEPALTTQAAFSESADMNVWDSDAEVTVNAGLLYT